MRSAGITVNMIIEFTETEIAVKKAKTRIGSIGLKKFGRSAPRTTRVVMAADFPALPNVRPIRTFFSVASLLDCSHAYAKMNTF